MAASVPPLVVLVTLDNVAIGMRVRRNPAHWRKNKWRDDGDGGGGTVVGYTDSGGVLVGENAPRRFATDAFNAITRDTGPAWAVVSWDTGRASIYPIGASGPLGTWWSGGPCFSLLQLD